jgi:hypothetical protein
LNANETASADRAAAKNAGWREYLEMLVKDWIPGQARNDGVRENIVVKVTKQSQLTRHPMTIKDSGRSPASGSP